MQKEGLRFSNDWGRYPHPHPDPPLEGEGVSAALPDHPVQPHPSPPLEGEGVSAFSAMVFFSLPFKGRVGVGMGFSIPILYLCLKAQSNPATKKTLCRPFPPSPP